MAKSAQTQPHTPPDGFDVVCVVGRVDFYAEGDTHPDVAAMQLIVDHGKGESTPGTYSWPCAHGGEVTVTIPPLVKVNDDTDESWKVSERWGDSRANRESLDRHPDDEGEEEMDLSFDVLRRENASRKERWHRDIRGWTGADWGNAMAGEAGEACNLVKKLRRHETSLTVGGFATAYNTPDQPALLDALAAELADVMIYADLLAAHYGISLTNAVRDKFNRVSKLQGFPERL